MKRVISLILTAALAVILLTALGGSARAAYFAVVNTDIMALETKFMPIRVGQTMYLPHTLFEDAQAQKDFGVYVSYNKDDYSITFFNANKILTFNINSGTAFDEQQVYQQRVVVKGDIVYVPALFICGQFGWTCSELATGPSLRVMTRDSRVTDQVFESYAKNYMSSLMSDYLDAQQTPVPSVRPSPTPTQTVLRDVFLTVDGGPDAYTNEILDILGARGVKAAFFLDPGSLDDAGDVLRRMMGTGHTIGLLCPLGSLDALPAANDAIDSHIFSRTRFVRVPGGSAQAAQGDVAYLIESGFRIWDATLAPRGADAQALENAVIDGLENTQGAVVISLESGKAAADALPAILDALTGEPFVLRVIRESTMPINEIDEVR